MAIRVMRTTSRKDALGDMLGAERTKMSGDTDGIGLPSMDIMPLAPELIALES